MPPAIYFNSCPVLVDGEVVHKDVQVLAGVLPVQSLQKREEGLIVKSA